MLGNQTICGTCGICGGRVTVPTVVWSIIAPIPTCESCGATAAEHGPVIAMNPRRTYTATITSSADIELFPKDPDDAA